MKKSISFFSMFLCLGALLLGSVETALANVKSLNESESIKGRYFVRIVTAEGASIHKFIKQ